LITFITHKFITYQIILLFLQLFNICFYDTLTYKTKNIILASYINLLCITSICVHCTHNCLRILSEDSLSAYITKYIFL